ncbi:hypothetical protein DS745_00635 [Anaerobacillus alkaliphilus]|uniref:Uncharacterized protein n=1 Tax=Anaerobacillus alkaliphilus TaxID=1548597 RepID=A0A4Q0VZ94_9BACI|nr:hypothetical protein [Anaerobacillus alkaliphilus]RXJ03931.1 hypothetical protein DS745_00635 [Anaerobacillus alkaliphilus]
MEGIYFYWLFWIGWVYTTFLLRKTKERLVIGAGILLLIILSSRHLVVGEYIVNGTIALSLLIGYYLISKNRVGVVVFFLCVSIISTISYVTFRLFQLYDPVWVMFHPTLKLSFLLVILILVLVKDQQMRIALLFVTVAQGELVYTIFLSTIVPEFLIGQRESLDIIAITSCIIFLWYAFERLVTLLDELVKKRTVLRTSRR